MFCSNCGKEIKDEDKFCSNCGKSITINSNTTLKNNDNILDEQNFTIAKRESISSAFFRIIGITLLFLVIAFLSMSLPMITTVLGLGLAALIISLFVRPLIGDCPYCKTKVKSYNNTGFICPRCKKNVAVKEDKFMKIKL